MSNIKTFNKKSRKGISPVIATVILVAVAVVIAAALAGFSSSLFGTYSSAGSAVTVKSIAIHASDGSGDLTLLNSGNVLDEIVSIQVLPNAPVATFTDGTTEIAPGGETIVGGITDLDGSGSFTAGQQVTVKMIMKSGLQITQSVIVTA